MKTYATILQIQSSECCRISKLNRIAEKRYNELIDLMG